MTLPFSQITSILQNPKIITLLDLSRSRKMLANPNFNQKIIKFLQGKRLKKC